MPLQPQHLLSAAETVAALPAAAAAAGRAVGACNVCGFGRGVKVRGIVWCVYPPTFGGVPNRAHAPTHTPDGPDKASAMALLLLVETAVALPQARRERTRARRRRRREGMGPVLPPLPPPPPPDRPAALLLLLLLLRWWVEGRVVDDPDCCCWCFSSVVGRGR